MSKSAVRFALLVGCFIPFFSVHAGITRTWTGSVNSNFSEPNNWSPSGVPASDDALVFPAATVNNDLPAGTAFGPMTFNGDVTINGNAMTLTGDVMVKQVSLTCNANVTIGAVLTLADSAVNGSEQGSQVYSSIDVNGKTLTIRSNASIKSLNGTGTVIGGSIVFPQDGTFDGTIAALIDLHGSMPNANVVVRNDGFWPWVDGPGTLGTVDAQRVVPNGTLKTKSITLHFALPGVSIASFNLNAAGASDQIQVTGTVTLENPSLVVTLSGSPSFGQHFRIIDNDGTDPVSGTFFNLPEGSAVNVNGTAFRLTYAGGDGNDVELISAATPSAAVSQGADTSIIGEPVALSATVTSGLGTPTGTVTFLDNGAAIGTSPLSNGTATFNASTLSVGSHTITALYSGGGAFFGVASGPVMHSVVKGDTTTTIAAVHTPSQFGAAEFRISSTPRAPAAGAVAGPFTLREGAKVIGSGSIDDGSGHILLPALPVGTHTLIASYGGSASFAGSDSAAFVVEVAAAPTQVTATSDENESTTDGSVTVKILVTPLTSAPSILTGTVTISENGAVVSQQQTTGALDVTLKLAGGHHTLSISYSGDANFLPSSQDLGVDSKAEPPVRRRAVRH